VSQSDQNYGLFQLNFVDDNTQVIIKITIISLLIAMFILLFIIFLFKSIIFYDLVDWNI